MLFSRNIAPSCSYCLHGSSIGNGEVACTKRGIVSVAGYCRRFQYDPLKREPEMPSSYPTDQLTTGLEEMLGQFTNPDNFRNTDSYSEP